MEDALHPVAFAKPMDDKAGLFAPEAVAPRRADRGGHADGHGLLPRRVEVGHDLLGTVALLFVLVMDDRAD